MIPFLHKKELDNFTKQKGFISITNEKSSNVKIKTKLHSTTCASISSDSYKFGVAENKLLSVTKKYIYFESLDDAKVHHLNYKMCKFCLSLKAIS